MKKIIYLIVLALFYSCNKSKNQEINKVENDSLRVVNTVSIYNDEIKDSQKIEKLIEAIKSEGDTLAFIELQDIYFNSGKRKEFLYYSLYMSNAYNYKEAYFSNYMILKTDFINEKNKLNNMYANFYLLKAYELGYKYSINSVKNRFNDSIPKSDEYWSLILESINKK